MRARAKKHLHKGWAVAGVVFTALAAVAPASGGTFSYSGSFQLAQGRYFYDQTVRGVFFVNGLTVTAGGLTLSASIPLIFQSSPYVSYSGLGILPSGGPESSLIGRRQGNEPVILPEPVGYKQFGIGDPLFSIGIRLWEETSLLPTLQVVGQVKIPLVTLETGFGTGEWDYGAGISLSKKLGGVFMFADVNYWILGDLPELELKDAWSYLASLGIPLSGGKYALFLSYSGCTTIIPEAAPPSSLGVGLSFQIGSRNSLMFNGSLGLSESNADFTASVSWMIGL